MLATIAFTTLTALAAPQEIPQPTCGAGYSQAMAFPLQTKLIHPSRKAHCYASDAADHTRIDELRNYRCITLQGLDLPGAGTVDLQLTRVNDVSPQTISLNGSEPGAPGNPSPTDMSLWFGDIQNLPDSRVCLAFSNVGVWGWVRTDQRLYQMVSFPKNGTWADFRVLFMDDVDKNYLAGSLCGDVINEPPDLPPDYGTCLAGLNPSGWTEQCADTVVDQLRLCTTALETDYQYYQRFNNVPAAEVYARFIIGAVAQQLRIDTRAVLEVNYLGIHTSAADPWLEQDIQPGQTSSPCCVDVVYEFQHSWGTDDLISKGARFNLGAGLGNAPVTADLYHMLSGAVMGCGVAVGKIGSGEDAFSLSTEMGPINYDNQNVFGAGGVLLGENARSMYFQIYGAGHEIGHNFGAPHSHAIRIDTNGTPGNLADDEGLDDCSKDPSGGARDCSTTSFMQNGLMSYCFSCGPDFLRNIRFDYHEEIAKCMRARTVNLPIYEDVHFVTDLGFSTAPDGATAPTLTFIGQDPGVDTITLATSNVPPHTWTSLFISVNGGYTQFNGPTKIVTIVPEIFSGIFLLWPPQAPGVPIDIALPDNYPDGKVIYLQHYFAIGNDLYGSNALALEVIH